MAGLKVEMMDGRKAESWAEWMVEQMDAPTAVVMAVTMVAESAELDSCADGRVDG